MRRLAGSLTVLSLLVLVARGQDGSDKAWDLRAASSPPMKVGARRFEEHRDTNKQTASATFSGKATPPRTTSDSIDYRLVHEVLAVDKDGKRAAKERISIERWMQQKDGQPPDASLEGKAVVVERGSGKATVRLEGDPTGVTDAAKQWLESELGKDETDDANAIFLPREPVKAGAEWTLDPAAIAKQALKGEEIDGAASSAKGKLVSVSLQDGISVGHIEVTVALKLKAWPGNPALLWKTGGVFESTMSLDASLEPQKRYSAKGKASFKLKGDAEGTVKNTPAVMSLDTDSSTAYSEGDVTDGAAATPPKEGAPAKPAALESTEERDEKGNAYQRVLGKPRKVVVGANLLQLASPPSGREVYAIFRDQPDITVLDPETLAETAKIHTARSPVSIWCDDKRIVVACKESKVVTIIDAAERKALKSVTVKDDATLSPTRIVGRQADGSFATIWHSEKGVGAALYFVREGGDPKKVAKVADLEWVTPTNGGTHLLLQSNFHGSPSGRPELFEIKTSKGVADPKLFGAAGSLHADFGRCFLTADQKQIVMPRGKVGGSSYQPWTYLATPDLARLAFDFQGAAFAELAKPSIFVAWGPAKHEGAGVAPAEISYVTRASGRIVRRVTAEGFTPHPAAYVNNGPDPRCTFVPEHELFIYSPDQNAKGEVIVMRCGPVSGGPADPQAGSKDEPPAAAKIGKPITFTPPFQKPEGAQAVVFKLKDGPSGIKIDPDKGTFRWTPAQADLGKHDIAIVAEVDGRTVTVCAWTIDVAP